MASLNHQQQDGLLILTLNGSLDFEGLRQVELPFAALAHRPASRTVVDLTHVDLVTTPAISMFVAAANTAKLTGGKIVFTQATPPVKNVLVRLRLLSVLHTVDGLAEAKAAAIA